MKSLARKIGLWLALYGGWGLFGIAFLDSSVLTFPGASDLLLIHLCSVQPHRAAIYAMQATLGSLLGAYLLYFVTSRGGRFLLRKISPGKMERARLWLERNDFAAILVAALLPPPAPLKVFLITAGVLQVNPVRYGLALLVGRSLRYGAVAWLGAHYGLQAMTYLKHNITWASLLIVVLIVGMTIIHRYFSRELPGAAAAENIHPASRSSKPD